MRISDWSSDVCSSDLLILVPEPWFKGARFAPRSSFAWSRPHEGDGRWELFHSRRRASWRSTASSGRAHDRDRSEEHTSELQSLMRNSYAVFCLKKKKKTKQVSDHPKKHNNNTTKNIIA